MTRSIQYFLALLSAATLTISGGGAKAVQSTDATEEAAFVSLPAISHNDSLRFKIYYFEAIKQQTSGNFDAAYDLLQHCLTINPNAAEAYFMLSFYDGILKNDSAALADVKKASELNPANNAYMERLGAGYFSINNLA